MNKPTQQDGGPAFPIYIAPDEKWIGETDPNGMSLRDYFAAHCDPSVYNPAATLKDMLGRAPSSLELAEVVASIRLAESDAILALLQARKTNQ